MARYLNPLAGNANIAINTAAAITVKLIGANTTDVELVSTVDAAVSFGIVDPQNPSAPPPPNAANVSAGANATLPTGSHFLPAYVPRGFGVAAGVKISCIAQSANGALWISEMG